MACYLINLTIPMPPVTLGDWVSMEINLAVCYDPSPPFVAKLKLVCAPDAQSASVWDASFEAKKANEKAGDCSQGCLALLSLSSVYIRLGKKVNPWKEGDEFLEPCGGKAFKHSKGLYSSGREVLIWYLVRQIVFKQGVEWKGQS